MRLARRTLEPSTREDEILAAALDRFSRHGFAASSLRDLAGDLGLNIATLYHYFESKEQILFRLQWDALTMLNAAAASALLASEGRPAAERLRSLLQVHARYCLEHRREAQLTWAELRALGDEPRAVIRRELKSYQRLFTDLVEQGIASAQLRPAGLPRLIAFTLLASCACTWYRPTGGSSVDEIGELVVDLAMNGVVVV